MLLHDCVDRWGLSSLGTDRYDFAGRWVTGYCLDVGCGPHNRFVRNFLEGHGIGIDVYPYAGLTDENVLPDLSHFPFADKEFDSVTFIANLNHVPEHLRDQELAEAFRVLKPSGNIILTMGRPWVEVLVHKLIAFYDKLFGSRLDIDSERGMDEDESYYVTAEEIEERLARAGFEGLVRKLIWTQWGLNQVFVAWKY
jgi:SAM-dependent methyltransferase